MRAYLWYTADKFPSSPINSSNSPSGTLVVGRLIGGLSASITACPRTLVSHSAERRKEDETHLGSLRIGREKSPLNVRSIPQVWRVGSLGCECQYSLDEGLSCLGFLKEQFHDRRQRLQLDLLSLCQSRPQGSRVNALEWAPRRSCRGRNR
jgi:hypothetical protein